MPGPLGRRGPGVPGERAHHAPADVEHVRRALLQQRLVERAVALGDARRGVVPRALGGGAGVDRLVGGLEHRLVVEQREVGVEDRGLGLAGARGDRVAVALDRGAGGGDALFESLTLARGVVRDAVGRRRGGAVQMVDRTDREPGRGGDAGQDIAGLRRRDLPPARPLRPPGWLASQPE